MSAAVVFNQVPPKTSSEYIAELSARKLPYTVKVYGADITINTHKVYPPGKLSNMFAKFLVERLNVKGKEILDIGAGCSELGIVLAKNGAKSVVGLDVNKHAVQSSAENIKANGLQDRVTIAEENIAPGSLGKYKNKFDIVIAGAPWETMSAANFQETPSDRQDMYRSFYDVDDSLMTAIMQDGFNLLKNKADGIYITSSSVALRRIKALADRHSVAVEIIAEDDLHKDGNLHYVLRLGRLTN